MEEVNIQSVNYGIRMTTPISAPTLNQRAKFEAKLAINLDGGPISIWVFSKYVARQCDSSSHAGECTGKNYNGKKSKIENRRHRDLLVHLDSDFECQERIPLLGHVHVQPYRYKYEHIFYRQQVPTHHDQTLQTLTLTPPQLRNCLTRLLSEINWPWFSSNLSSFLSFFPPG